MCGQTLPKRCQLRVIRQAVYLKQFLKMQRQQRGGQPAQIVVEYPSV